MGEALDAAFQFGASLFEGGGDAIGGAVAGAGEAAGGGGGAGLAELVGTGEGLFGGTTGLEGTLAAGGAEGGIGTALGGGGATALGTAESFLANPAASGFNLDAGTPGFNTAGDSLLPANASPTLGSGTTAVSPGTPNSVFNTGTNPLPGTNATGAPGAIGASAVSAPTGVSPLGGVDPTAAAGGTVPGAQGPTSVGGAPVSGGSGASSGFSLDSLLSKASNSITNNPLGVGLGAAGLGYNIYSGQKQTANQKALAGDAAAATASSQTLATQGAALEQYLTNGTLPPAYQQQVDQAIQSAKTAAISNAAAQGLPTDPTKNTALAATLAQIDNQRSAMQTQVATQLFQSGAGLTSQGLQAAGLSGQLYQALVSNDTTQAANTGKAIASLASALNGKSSASVGGTNITIG